MITRKIYLLPLILLFAACTNNDLLPTEDAAETPHSVVIESQYEQGHVRVLLSEDLSERIETIVRQGERQVKALAADETVSQISVRSMKRTFPHAGRFEARTRKAGLHLWYDVEFDTQIPLDKAGKTLSSIQGIRKVEYLPTIAQKWDPQVIERVNETTRNIAQSAAAAAPFNDPQLPNQWHYHNDGTLGANYRTGADINVFNAWSYTTGTPDVIVAVVDGGVDYMHEDIAANMWINTAEKNGSSSIDDDSNGYTDDIHGYNFVANIGKILPEDHGTHVAGTIAAVNNNGKGVCGIAGGDGQNNSGVRIMSCQIFVPDDDPYADNSGSKGATAIKYAADNGAVICQNSWGYVGNTEISASDKAAIDYFIEYAGIDENGKQTGPMRGGIVIFAAGNEDKELAAPASYEKVMAVSSIAPDFRKAYYSNYGSWVDLAAPGGDIQSFGSKGTILSTVVSGYGYMQGTSMACPHVSGAAALVLSHFKRSGYNADMLRARLEKSATSIDSYNSSYKGKLGGLVNTFAAIAGASTTPPSKVGTPTGSVQSNTVTLKWTVPTDSDDGKASGFNVYYRKTSISGIDVTNPPADVMISTFSTGNLNAGDVFEAKIDELDFESTYYFAVNAFDFSGNFSSLSSQITQTTSANNPPIINALDNTDVEIKSYQTVVLHFSGNDPDGHEIWWSLQSAAPGLELIDMREGKAQITITGTRFEPGIYTTRVVLEDKYGASASQTINYEILANRTPEIVNPIPNLHIGALNNESSFSIADYFIDPDEEPLKYTFNNTDPNVVNVNENKGKLYIVSLAYGLVQVSITATDGMGKSVSQQFDVLVRDGSQPVDIYPNPVKDFLYVRTGEDKRCLISIFSNAGTKVFEKEMDISPFAPAKIDVSRFSGGTYNVNIKEGNGEIKKQIIKL